jgi:hypothetical protein
MSDLERTLRDARATLPEPDDAATAHARSAVLTAARPRRRRAVISALALAAALGGAFAAGLALASGGASQPEANGPGFLPSSGWETFQTGLTAEPQAVSATAATIPFDHDVLDGTFPWLTAAKLRRGDVLLQAMFMRRGEVEAVDASFPPRSLPLSLGDATPTGLEGQPAGVSALRLDARVHGWSLTLYAFSGNRWTAAARAAAQRELARLVVPQGPPGVLTKRPALRHAADVCPLSALRASVQLQGATGSLLGAVVVRNASAKACRLRGRPTVELRDANGVPISVESRPSPPLWRQLGSPQPPGWPVVRLAPGRRAQVFIQLRNWCVAPVKPVFVHTYLPGVGAKLPAPARITARCDDPHAPVSLAVGPVEPPTR